jgi:hypothetical protein
LEDFVDMPFQELPAGPVDAAFGQFDGLSCLGVELVAVAAEWPPAAGL